MGMVRIIYGEISEGSGPKLPPPPGSSTRVTDQSRKIMWIPLYDIDGDSLMNSTN